VEMLLEGVLVDVFEVDMEEFVFSCELLSE
jgi:hypothetical protein